MTDPTRIEVVAGDPDDTELAALTAVLLARAAVATSAAPRPAPAAGRWGHPATLVRGGTTGWWSGLPVRP